MIVQIKKPAKNDRLNAVSTRYRPRRGATRPPAFSLSALGGGGGRRGRFQAGHGVQGLGQWEKKGGTFFGCEW